MPEVPPTIVEKIRTLVQIAEDLRHGRDFSITRLTLLKSLCSDPDDAAQFALYLAKKTLLGTRLEEATDEVVHSPSRSAAGSPATYSVTWHK